MRGAHSRCSVCVNLTHKPLQTGGHTRKCLSPPGWAGRAPYDPAAISSGPTVAGLGPHLESHLFTQSAERWGGDFLRANGEAATCLCPRPFTWVGGGLGHVFVLQGVPEHPTGDGWPTHSARDWGVWQSQGAIWPLHSSAQWLSTFNLLEVTQSLPAEPMGLFHVHSKHLTASSVIPMLLEKCTFTSFKILLQMPSLKTIWKPALSVTTCHYLWYTCVSIGVFLNTS